MHVNALVHPQHLTYLEITFNSSADLEVKPNTQNMTISNHFENLTYTGHDSEYVYFTHTTQ